MEAIKKILAGILIFGMVAYSIPLSFAQGDDLAQKSKNVIFSRIELKKIPKGDRYIRSIDRLVLRITKDIGKINSLQSRLEDIGKKLDGKNDKKSLQLKAILNYLEAKLVLAEVHYATEYAPYENSGLARVKTSISDSEKHKVETQILLLQSNLSQGVEGFIKSVVSDFEKYSNYQEEGNFAFDAKLDTQGKGKLDTHLKLNNYEAITSNFDSQIKGDFKLDFESSIDNQDGQKLNMEGFFDFISQDGNIFVLLDRYKVTSRENIEEFQESLDLLEKIAKQRGYVKYTDEDSQQALRILKNLNPNAIIGDLNAQLQEPLFKIKNRVGERYYLIPTKHACDLAKQLANKFDPINGSVCSQRQYENLLEDEFKNIDFYIELAVNETKLGFKVREEKMDSFEGYITYNANGVKRLNVNITPDQRKYAGEGITIDYKKQSHFDIKASVEAGKIKIEFFGVLDKNNKFNNIDTQGKITGVKDLLTWEYDLVNRNITGKIDYDSGESSRYDYASGEFVSVPSSTMHVKILGQTSFSNTLSDLSIDLNASNNRVEQLENTQGTIRFDGKNFRFTVENQGPGTKLDINLTGQYDRLRKIVTAFDSDILIEKKSREYNTQTFNFEYIGDYETVFDSQLKLNQGVITGKARVYNDGTILLELDTNGNYISKKATINNTFKLSEEYGLQILRMLGIEKDSANVLIHMNIDTDVSGNNNNLNIFFDVISGVDTIIELQLDNTGTRHYGNIEIQSPSSAVDIQDITQ